MLDEAASVDAAGVAGAADRRRRTVEAVGPPLGSAVRLTARLQIGPVGRGSLGARRRRRTREVVPTTAALRSRREATARAGGGLALAAREVRRRAGLDVCLADRLHDRDGPDQRAADDGATTDQVPSGHADPATHLSFALFVHRSASRGSAAARAGAPRRRLAGLDRDTRQ